MTGLRCHRDVSTLDGHCIPCRRHLGMEPQKMPRKTAATRPARQSPRLYVTKAANPSRAEVKAAYEASLLDRDVIDTGPQQPSLPRVAWLERPMPEIA